MKSAAAYTNKRRVMAEAGNTKVEQIGNIATNYGPLQPVLPSQASPLTPTACGPDFTHYVYFKGCRRIESTNCSDPPINMETIIAGRLNDTGAAINGYGTSARFHSLFGIISIDSDTLLLIDRSYQILYKYTISTNYVSVFAGQDGVIGSTNGTTLLNSTFDYINDFTYDSANKILYVSTNSNIRKIDLNTNTISTFLNSQSGYGFSTILYINGFLYGIDPSQSLIYKINVSTTSIDIIAGAVSSPKGYVDGTGSGVRFNTSTNKPSILAYDNSTYIYIADVENNKLRKINISTNEVSTVANVNNIKMISYNPSDGLIYYLTSTNILYSINPNNVTAITKIIESSYDIYEFIVINSTMFYAVANESVLIKIKT